MEKVEHLQVPLASSLHTFESEALGEAYSDLEHTVKGIAPLDEIPALKDALLSSRSYGDFKWIKRLEPNKSGHYYLRKLSRSEKKRFIKNYKASHDCITFRSWMDVPFSDMDEFLGIAFLWDRTPEGYQYWEELDARMRWITNLQ